MPIREYQVRPESEFLKEQTYLRERVEQVEKGLGKIAGQHPGATPLTQPLDTLDRARELAGQLIKQARVRPLEEAITAQIEWLQRARANQEASKTNGEPKMELRSIDLDLRILSEILAGWRARRN